MPAKPEKESLKDRIEHLMSDKKFLEEEIIRQDEMVNHLQSKKLKFFEQIRRQENSFRFTLFCTPMNRREKFFDALSVLYSFLGIYKDNDKFKEVSSLIKPFSNLQSKVVEDIDLQQKLDIASVCKKIVELKNFCEKKEGIKRPSLPKRILDSFCMSDEFCLENKDYFILQTIEEKIKDVMAQKEFGLYMKYIVINDINTEMDVVLSKKFALKKQLEFIESEIERQSSNLISERSLDELQEIDRLKLS